MSSSKIGASGRRSGQRRNQFFVWGIMKMGEAEAPEKAWLTGVCGGRGETTDSGGGVYGYGEDRN